MEAVLRGAEPIAIAVEDASHVAYARAAVQRMARDLGFDETRIGQVAIATAEAVSNVVKHAGRGTLLARHLVRGASVGIEMIALDSGPGMASFPESSRDGVSTSGTPGTGLGAIGRLARELDVYTHPGAGTILRMTFWDRDDEIPEGDYEIGVVSVPKTGETVCGDAWGVEVHEAGATFVIADGLGHGAEASRASQSAIEALRRHPDDPAIRLLDHAHAKLRSTRGAAVAVIRHDAATDRVGFAGVGNIAAVIIDGDQRRAMVSHNGILGHNVAKSQEFEYRWPPHSLLVAHSDGLQTQWSLGAFPGIGERHPSIIAALLFREHSRGRDDTTVVVARHRPQGPQ